MLYTGILPTNQILPIRQKEGTEANPTVSQEIIPVDIANGMLIVCFLKLNFNLLLKSYIYSFSLVSNKNPPALTKHMKELKETCPLLILSNYMRQHLLTSPKCSELSLPQC